MVIIVAHTLHLNYAGLLLHTIPLLTYNNRLYESHCCFGSIHDLSYYAQGDLPLSVVLVPVSIAYESY